MLDEFLNGLNIFRIIARGQGKGSARTTRPTGAANAVNIIFCMCRHIEIKHMAHGRNIQPTRRDIGRNEIGRIAVFKLVEHPQPHVLIHIAMQGNGFVIILLQIFQQVANVAFAIAKDNAIGDVFGFKQAAQSFAFFRRRDFRQFLAHIVIGRRRARHFNAHRCR